MQVAWCLGNIAGDCSQYRDAILNLQIVHLIGDRLDKALVGSEV